MFTLFSHIATPHYAHHCKVEVTISIAHHEALGANIYKTYGIALGLSTLPNTASVLVAAYRSSGELT